MITTKGVVTNAVFGVTRMLLKLIEDQEPAAIAIAFDTPQPTFRHTQYKEYKAHRPPSPAEFRSQVPLIKDVCRAMGITVLEAPGYEADDILGTLSTKAAKEDFNCLIISGDTDILQMVSPHISVMLPKKGISETITFNEEKVVEKYGLLPKQLIDYKALKGDPSDNIPGVPGIGDKTAVALLQEYGNVDTLIEKTPTISKESLRTKLTEHKEQLLMSRSLTTIETDMPLPKKPSDCVFTGIPWDKLVPVLKELELTALAKHHEAAEQGDLFAALAPAAHNTEVDKQKVKEVRLMKYLLNPDRALTNDDITPEDVLSIDDLKKDLKDKGLFELYTDLELPLSDILETMEQHGIKIDIPYLLKMSREMEKQLSEFEKDIYAAAGEEFNLNSPKQLAHILFEKLSLPVIKKTKTGYSTDAEVLETLAEKFPIASKIIEYRQISKLKNTYVDTLPALAQEDKHQRIHTSFNQTTTATGRLSSSEPNIQNIPARTEVGRKIRAAFIPGHEGWKLLSADYSQIELRILAHVSQDTNLIEAFKSGEDIHKKTASEIFEVPLGDVTNELRSRAKAVNFGIIYGISAMGLAKNTGVTPDEAQRYITAYFSRYPKIKEYMDGILVKAKKDGFVETPLKRRRYIHDINNPNGRIRAFAERAAINAPIQGAAADIIKLAMLAVDNVLRREKLKCTMLLQVHDELVFELPENEVDRATELIKKTMENAYHMDVPLVVDVNAGNNWLEAK